MAGTGLTHDNLIQAFERRFDYLSARSVAAQVLDSAGVAKADQYDAGALARIGKAIEANVAQPERILKVLPQIAANGSTGTSGGTKAADAKAPEGKADAAVEAKAPDAKAPAAEAKAPESKPAPADAKAEADEGKVEASAAEAPADHGHGDKKPAGDKKPEGGGEHRKK